MTRFKLLTSTSIELAVPIKFQNVSHDSCSISIVWHKCITVQYNENTASTWNDSLLEFLVLTCVQLLSIYEQNGFFTSKSLFESSSLVLVSTVSQHIDIGE